MAVELDVGGVYFKTTLNTLRSIPDNYFDKMFSGNWKNTLDKEGRVFIDRDGEIFNFVLDFLRNGPDMVLPSDKKSMDKLMVEARFYCIPQLEKLIDEKMVTDIGADANWPPMKYDPEAKLFVFYFDSSKVGDDYLIALSLEQLRRDPKSYFYNLADKLAKTTEKNMCIEDNYCCKDDRYNLYYVFKNPPGWHVALPQKSQKSIFLLLKFLELGPIALKARDIDGDGQDLLRTAMLLGLSIAVPYIRHIIAKPHCLHE